MSLWTWIRNRVTKRQGVETAPTRAEGGVADPSTPDTHSTTGSTPSGEFVGRASGDDPGDVESPAKMRVERPHGRQNPGDAGS